MVRSTALSVTLTALLALPVSAQGPPAGGDLPEPTATLEYGADELEFGELRMPEGPGPFPVVVTIHGGCWLDRLGQGSLRPVAAALTAEGIATWDINYRRLGHEGGGWPGTFQDVGAGVDHLRVIARDYPIDLERVVLAGHSSGAQLAVWAAGRSSLPATSEIRGDSPLPVRAAVGIDGPMDIEAWRSMGFDAEVCGGPVISELMGGARDEVPGRYQAASPVEMPEIDADVFLTPAGMMLSLGGQSEMEERLKAKSVSIVPVSSSDHFQLITPTEEAWGPVLQAVLKALGGGP